MDFVKVVRGGVEGMRDKSSFRIESWDRIWWKGSVGGRG